MNDVCLCNENRYCLYVKKDWRQHNQNDRANGTISISNTYVQQRKSGEMVVSQGERGGMVVMRCRLDVGWRVHQLEQE